MEDNSCENYVMSQFFAMQKENEALKEENKELRAEAANNAKKTTLEEKAITLYYANCAEEYDYTKTSIQTLKDLRDGKLSLTNTSTQNDYYHVYPVCFDSTFAQTVIHTTDGRNFYIRLSQTQDDGYDSVFVLPGDTYFETQEKAMTYGKEKALKIIDAIIKKREAEEKKKEETK